MNERMHFIRLQQRGEHSISELCRRFGISRKTAYKWLRRYCADGGCSEGMPVSCYEPSPRPLPEPTWGRDFVYSDELETVRTDKHGVARWHGRSLLISSALRHELLGLDPIGPDAWQVCFGPLTLGRIERPAQGRFRLRFQRLA